MMSRLKDLRLGEMPMKDSDLSISQLNILALVHQAQGSRLQDIADGLNLSAPTVSVAVKRLETDGWLDRRSDPQDGRASCVYLTPKAKKVIDQAHKTQQMAIQAFLSGLTEKEQKQFINLFKKAMNSIMELSIQPWCNWHRLCHLHGHRTLG